MKERMIVIYDGNCNLCVSLVQVLEKIDRGSQFEYAPMPDLATLERSGITARDCEMGMILIDPNPPQTQWQGSAAAEEIGRLLPLGNGFVMAYRLLPGVKWVGDRTYEQVRDHRYQLFGKRDRTYYSIYYSGVPVGCGS
jgi:predicted DCC family thiol-disulfide oxidoreductase YuxK